MTVEITLFDRELNIIERRAIQGDNYPPAVYAAVMPPMHKLLQRAAGAPDATVAYRTVTFRHRFFGAYIEEA